MAELFGGLVALLRASRCPFARGNAESQEIWDSPLSGRHISVPRSIKAPYTADEFLTQAGLRKAS
jgi:hypothetical protein